MAILTKTVAPANTSQLAGDYVEEETEGETPLLSALHNKTSNSPPAKDNDLTRSSRYDVVMALLTSFKEQGTAALLDSGSVLCQSQKA